MSMIALMVPFQTFSFLDFLVDLLKNSSHLSVICLPVVCLVSMFLRHIVEYFGPKPGTQVFGYVKDSFAPQDRVQHTNHSSSLAYSYLYF
jgi:hypothetical protein